MADKKISQLSSASTPLAGTEVLPIVQSSTTVKVAADDLTVKNVRSNATTGILQIAGPAAAATRTMTVPDANFTVARTDAAQTFTGAQTFASTISVGNATPSASGAGVTFPATLSASTDANTLDDYEEGVWSPTLVASTTNFASVTYNAFTGAKYTKIGRLVYVSGVLRTSAVDLTGAAGIVQIGNLPFANGASSGSTQNGISQLVINWIVGLAGDFPLGGYISAGASAANLTYRTAINGRTYDLEPADIDTGTNQIWFAATYHT